MLPACKDPLCDHERPTVSTQAAQPPDLRPRGVGEILDAAFRLTLDHWRTLVLATLCVVVPIQILSTIVVFSAFPSDLLTGQAAFEEQPDPEAFMEDFGVFMAGVLVASLLTGLMVVLSIAACFKAVANAFLGGTPDWRDSVRFAFARLGPLLWVSVLYVLGVTLGFFVFFFPAVWLAVAWTLSYPALLVEDARGTHALRRSFRLVRGRWWPTFGVLLVGVILIGVIAWIVQFVVSLPVFFVDSILAAAVLNTLAAILGYAISTPLQAALVVMVFFDLRVRKEGLDLELLADRLGSPRPAGVLAGGGSGGGGWAPPQPPGEEGGSQAPAGWAPPEGSTPPPER